MPPNQNQPERLKPTPELEAFADRLVESIRVVSQQEALKLKDALRAEFISILDRRIEATDAKILALRTEIREDMIEVKQELHDQSTTLNQHSQDIGIIQQQLKVGEKWMKEAGERLSKVEQNDVHARISLAKLAAKIAPHTISAGIGGAITATIMKLLLSAPAVPPKAVEPVKPEAVKPAEPKP